MGTLRFAWRSLARSPGFVIVAVLALGLGLGLSTTMFAVLDAVVNPFMPYRDPETLFTVHWWYSMRHGSLQPGVMYAAVKDAHSLSNVVPIAGANLALETGDDIQDIYVARVPPEFFPVTGVPPARGRGFVASDGEDVVVLTDALWRRVFGRRRSLSGATIRLGNRTYTVVGVMPRGAIVPNYASAWLPLDPSTIHYDPMPLVRLKPGISKAAADAEFKAISRTLTSAYGSPDYGISLELATVRERKEELRDIHKAMIGAALGVLLIACVNLAHLMLARGLAKRRELALRMALGASRAVVVRQMFAECVIITLAGSALGALSALWGTDVLTNRMTPQLSWIGLVVPQLSWRVFALGAATAAGSAVLFGLVPAIRVALMVDVTEPLKDGSGTTGRSRQRYSPLVVAEVGLALVLMMGGGLLLRTIQQLRRVEYTFDARNLLDAEIGLRWSRNDSITIRRSVLLTAVANVPGVKDLAFSTYLRSSGGMTAEMVPGDSIRRLQGGPALVSWRYLRVIGLRILKGRDFEPGDSAVAILNPVAAKHLYPKDDPVGHMIKIGAPGGPGPWIRIIGVARSPRTLNGDDLALDTPAVWMTARDQDVARGSIVIRTAPDDAKVAVAVKHVLHDIPNRQYSYVQRFDGWRDEELESRAFLAKMFVTMGTVALFLSALGLYGVLAYAVNQRMREFAVRIALGAEARQLFGMVMHDGAVMLLAGVGVGAFGALMASRLLDSVLTSVLPSDVISLIACEVVLLGVGFAAAFGPARRAVRANPLDILRAV
jgi:putative ABC transport system permease protein